MLISETLCVLLRVSQGLISAHKGIIRYHFRRQSDTFSLHNDPFWLLDTRQANEFCQLYEMPFLQEVSACHASVENNTILRVK